MSAADDLAALRPGTLALEEFGDPVAHVAASTWADAAQTCRDVLGLTYLDMLTVCEDFAGDGAAVLAVVAYLWSPARHTGLLLRTTVPVDAPTLASVTPLFPGADWHEREATEMFGVTFLGHPNPGPLLLPDPPPVPTPLRKGVALARREQTETPVPVGPERR